MATYRSFEELEIWQEARVLTKRVREICKRPEVKRDFAFVDQITRSVRSIGANIAEGFESMSQPQFIEFLGYSKRSCGETRAHLYDAFDEGYVSKEEFDELSELSKKICRMIAGFIHYLQSLNKSQKRTMKKATTNQKSKINNQQSEL